MNAPTSGPTQAPTRTEQLFHRELVVLENCRQNGSSHFHQESLPARDGALICVIDQDGSLRKELARILAHGHPIESFETAQAFLNRKIHPGPCCILLDSRLPDLGGMSLPEFLSIKRRSEQVVLISGNKDIAACAKAFKTGAVDFLTKPLRNDELLRAVERGIGRSEQLFRRNQKRATAQALLDQLTPREREVLGFVIAGHLNKVIGAELGIAEKTVKKHRAHFMQKLNVDSIAELIWFCLGSELKPTFFDGGPRSHIQTFWEFLPYSAQAEGYASKWSGAM